MAPIQTHQIVFLSTLAASCAYAELRGGGPERIGALINIVATIASMALVAPLATRWIHPDIPLFAVDMLVTIAFFVLALRSDRFWPIWSFGFGLIDVSTHCARFFFPNLIPHAYAIGTVIWAYPALISMVIGTAGAARRRRRPPKAFGS